jgi:hypothetical protein
MGEYDMKCKLHINLNLGHIEAEGSEAFVMRVYEDFKDKLSFSPNHSADSDDHSENGNEDEQGERKKPTPHKNSKPSLPKKQSNTSAKTQLQVVPVFSSGELGKKFLSEIKKYDIPKSHQKKITLFIYIMQQIGVKNISVNHVFTCYRLLTEKTPLNLTQAIIDAKNKNMWVINDSWQDLKTHHKGDEMVEHDLIKANNK